MPLRITAISGARPERKTFGLAPHLALDALLPEGIAAVATRGEIEAPLFPEEEPALRHAVEARRREFRTGRACAREALARLGLPPQAIPVAAGGAPEWPGGVVGSIAHCAGYRAAAAGWAADFDAVAIDAEPNRRLPAGVLAAIALPVERGRVGRLLREAPGVSWDRLLFSAKEAVYKAWFPLTGAKLGFDDAEIAFDSRTHGFSARLRFPRPGRARGRSIVHGRWAVGGGILATAIALPATVG